MSIAVVITDRDNDTLCALLRRHLPGVAIQSYPHITDPDDVRLAVLWAHPPGITVSMPNLLAVTSMGAGMDHLEADHAIAPQISRHRIVTPVLQQNMAQYVLAYLLNDHRYLQAYRQQQQANEWQVLETDQPMPTVGFLGLGALGAFVADQCASLGFATLAWTRKQDHPQHRCVHGDQGLKEVCEQSDYLVVLLPLNEQTRGIISERTLRWCRPGMTLINVARGDHVEAADLISALDAGVIRQAVLDVFSTEPLPRDHSYWNHSGITLTPHSSARSDVRQTADAIVRIYQDLPLQG